nr:MAG TPA: hypothetical protein [Caudoviricetes sp.]
MSYNSVVGDNIVSPLSTTIPEIIIAVNKKTIKYYLWRGALWSPYFIPG